MSLRRIERCFTDNIYLIESLPQEEHLPFERNYLIMGNSGNMYQVTISNEPKCTCPDYVNRSNRCKHIYFVLMRIMNISNYNNYQYTDEELTEMFSNIPPVAKNLLYQGEKSEESKTVNQKFEKDDVCPICLDPLENGKELDYCKYSCGQTIHKKCFSMWEKSKGAICVFCRAKWYNNIYGTKPKEVSMHPIVLNQSDKKIDEEDKKEDNKEDNKKDNKEDNKEDNQKDEKENNKENSQEDNKKDEKENDKENNKEDDKENNKNNKSEDYKMDKTNYNKNKIQKKKEKIKDEKYESIEKDKKNIKGKFNNKEKRKIKKNKKINRIKNRSRSRSRSRNRNRSRNKEFDNNIK